jgi:hypothetical protein
MPDDKPKRDPKLIVPWPSDQIKYDYPGKKELMKLIPSERKAEDGYAGPRGSSVLINAFTAWRLKDSLLEEYRRYMLQTSIRGEEFRKLYQGNFDDMLPIWKLAHDVWVIYDMNADLIPFGMSPYQLFVWLAGNSFQMATELGYDGSYAGWAIEIRNAGRTHNTGKCCNFTEEK